jgi:hypothetical protein
MSAKPTLADTLSRFRLERCRSLLQASLTTPSLHVQWSRFKAEVQRSTQPYSPVAKHISTYDSLQSLRSTASRLEPRKRTQSTAESLYSSLSRKTVSPAASLSTALLRNSRTESKTGSFIEKKLLVEVMPLELVLRSNEALEKMGDDRCLPRRYTEEVHKLARLIHGKLSSF